MQSFAAKPKNPMKSKPRVNNVKDITSETATVGTSSTVEEQVNQIDNMLKKHNIYGANYERPKSHRSRTSQCASLHRQHRN